MFMKIWLECPLIPILGMRNIIPCLRPQAGNNVSHAKNRNKRTFQPNLHKHRFWVESENRYVSLTVSANGMRTIDKNGIDKVLADLRSRGEKI